MRLPLTCVMLGPREEFMPHHLFDGAPISAYLISWSSHLSAWSRRLAEALQRAPAPRIRFFAGIPLLGPDGLVLGSLCLVGRDPRQPTDDQCTAFTELAGVAV